MRKHVKCPTCGKDVPWADGYKFKPFCNERCKLIDLGEWIMEKNSIPGEPVSAEAEANLFEPKNIS